MARRIQALSSPARPQLQAIFEDRTKSIYTLMVVRVGEKKNPRGTVVRPAREIPFSLFEFREWLLAQLGSDGWNGVVRCEYCSAILNVQTVVFDHIIPITLTWNGDLGLDNLCCCCALCNRRKGAMSADGFRKLTEFLSISGFDPRDLSDIYSRLGTGGEGAKAMWKRKSFAMKK